MTILGRLNPHERMLVLLSSRPQERSSLRSGSGIPGDAAGRAAILRLAQEHGLYGLVLHALVDAEFGRELAADVREALAAQWRQLRLQAALWDLERDRLLSLLESAGFTPVILKGGALRETVYADPADRSLGDLDLLLPPDQIEAARSRLERAGYLAFGTAEVQQAYREHHFHYRMGHSNGFTVELHWALSRSRGFQLDEAAFISRAAALARPGRSLLRVPSAEDMILHICSQNEEDAFGRLRRLVDLDRVIAAAPAIDWSYLREQAHRGRLETLTAISLQLAHVLFGAPLADGFIESLTLPGLTRFNVAVLEPVAFAVRSPQDRPGAASELLLFWSAVGWRNRIQRLVLASSPSTDPLDAVLRQERERGAFRSGLRGPRPGPLVRMAGYQAWTYLGAVRALFSRSGRGKYSFWDQGRASREERIGNSSS